MEPQIIEVEINEWEKASSPDVLYSGRLGPCIAIAVYNPKTHTGYMLHDSNPNLMGLTSDFFDIIKAENPDFSKMRAFIAGGDTSFPGYDPRDAIESREYVERIVKEMFTRHKFKILWSPYGYAAELSLNTKNGRFTHTLIKTSDLEDMMDDY